MGVSVNPGETGSQDLLFYSGNNQEFSADNFRGDA